MGALVAGIIRDGARGPYLCYQLKAEGGGHNGVQMVSAW